MWFSRPVTRLFLYVQPRLAAGVLALGLTAPCAAGFLLDELNQALGRAQEAGGDDPQVQQVDAAFEKLLETVQGAEVKAIREQIGKAAFDRDLGRVELAAMQRALAQAPDDARIQADIKRQQAEIAQANALIAQLEELLRQRVSPRLLAVIDDAFRAIDAQTPAAPPAEADQPAPQVFNVADNAPVRPPQPEPAGEKQGIEITVGDQTFQLADDFSPSTEDTINFLKAEIDRLNQQLAQTSDPQEQARLQAELFGRGQALAANQAQRERQQQPAGDQTPAPAPAEEKAGIDAAQLLGDPIQRQEELVEFLEQALADLFKKLAQTRDPQARQRLEEEARGRSQALSIAKYELARLQREARANAPQTIIEDPAPVDFTPTQFFGSEVTSQTNPVEPPDANGTLDNALAGGLTNPGGSTLVTLNGPVEIQAISNLGGGNYALLMDIVGGSFAGLNNAVIDCAGLDLAAITGLGGTVGALINVQATTTNQTTSTSIGPNASALSNITVTLPDGTICTCQITGTN